MELGRIYLLHIASSLSDSLVSILHLRFQTYLYQFVIPAQLSSMITTHVLVPIGGVVFIESADGKVQHAIVGGGVFQDEFVGCSLGESGGLYAFIYKLVVVEITLVYLPHIEQAEQGNATNGELLAQFALEEKHQQHHTDKDNDERTQGIGRNHSGTHLT